MNFYRLKDDVEYPDRWYLGDIRGADNWDLLTIAHEVNRKLEVDLYKDGNEMDFTLTEVYGVPIVSSRVEKLLRGISNIVFIPLIIRNKICKYQYFAMVIPSIVDCVDEDNSEFHNFIVNDPVRPDKAGEYRAFKKLRLRSNGIHDIDLFRLKKFETALIVSERVKIILEKIDATGLDLSSVVE